jgi:WD40 repeat protein
MLASGSVDQTIKLWEVSSGRLIRSLEGHSGHVYSVAFSPDGKMLASGDLDQTIKLWEVSSGRLIRSLEGHSGPVHSVAFSPDGKMLASGGSDQAIKLWEVSSSSCEPTTDHRVMKVNWNRQRIADSKVNDNRQRS